MQLDWKEERKRMRLGELEQTLRQRRHRHRYHPHLSWAFPPWVVDRRARSCCPNLALRAGVDLYCAREYALLST